MFTGKYVFFFPISKVLLIVRLYLYPLLFLNDLTHWILIYSSIYVMGYINYINPHTNTIDRIYIIFPLVLECLQFLQRTLSTNGAVEYTGCTSADWSDPHNECPGYNTKQYDAEVPVMQQLWRMWSTYSLPSLPGPLLPGVVTSDRSLSIGQIELKCWTELLEIELFWYLNCVLMLNSIVWNRNIFNIESVLTLNWIV